MSKDMNINGIEIKFNETIEYCDYFGDEGLISIDFKKRLLEVDRSKGKKHGNNFKKELIKLTRWISEAPRKRRMRGLSELKFITVMTSENLFKGEKGEIPSSPEQTTFDPLLSSFMILFEMIQDFFFFINYHTTYCTFKKHWIDSSKA